MIPSNESGILGDLRRAEETGKLLAECRLPVRLWEALCLLRSEGDFLGGEMERLAALRAAGRAAVPGAILSDSVRRVRDSLGPLAEDLGGFLDHLTVSLTPLRRAAVIGLLLSTPGWREEIRSWLQDPPGATDAAEVTIRSLVEDLGSWGAEAGGVSEGIDPEVFHDLLQAERLRGLLRTAGARLEPWEAFFLTVEDRSAVGTASDRWRALYRRGGPEDDGEGLVRFFEGVLDLRSRWGPEVAELRGFVGSLSLARIGGETMDLVIGFLMASPEGRSRARQWLESPETYRREASVRLEGLIGRVQNYQRALRAVLA